MNNYKIYKSIIVVLCIVIFTSCGQDYLTKTIEFEDIGFDPAMVINTKISSTQDSMLISVSKNVNYAQNANADYTFINGADIELAVGGTLKYEAEEIELVTFDSVLYNYLIILDEEVISGKEYTLTGSHPEYPDVESTIFLPTPSEPQNITFEPDVRIAVNFFEPISQDLISFNIVDNPNEENYYLFQVKTVETKDTFFFENPMGGVDTQAFVIQPFPLNLDVEYFNAVTVDNNTLLLSDEGFNGETISLDIYSGTPDFDIEFTKERTFEYRNITKSDYLFRQSYSNYAEAENIGVFAEPVTLFSNIINGFGLFSGEDLFQYEIE